MSVLGLLVSVGAGRVLCVTSTVCGESGHDEMLTPFLCLAAKQ